jgi:predicted dehydrogenase
VVPVKGSFWQVADPHRHVFTLPSRGGGPVCDLGVHILDGIHLLTGTGFPAMVTARGLRSKDRGFDIAERAVILVEYPNGLLFSLAISGTAAGPHEISVVDGTAGRIGIGPQEIQGVIVRRNLDPELRGATRRHLENFFESVHKGNRPDAAISAAFPATLVCQMANLSIAMNRAARWDATNYRVELE